MYLDLADFGVTVSCRDLSQPILRAGTMGMFCAVVPGVCMGAKD